MCTLYRSEYKSKNIFISLGRVVHAWQVMSPHTVKPLFCCQKSRGTFWEFSNTTSVKGFSCNTPWDVQYYRHPLLHPVLMYTIIIDNIAEHSPTLYTSLSLSLSEKQLVVYAYILHIRGPMWYKGQVSYTCQTMTWHTYIDIHTRHNSHYNWLCMYMHEIELGEGGGDFLWYLELLRWCISPVSRYPDLVGALYCCTCCLNQEPFPFSITTLQ